MRNKQIKIACTVIAIFIAGYGLFKWFNDREIDYLALIMVVFLPLIAVLLQNYTKTDYVFSFDHSDWTDLGNGDFQLIIPYSDHGLENPKPTFYMYSNGVLSEAFIDFSLTNKDVVATIGRETRSGEIRIA